MNVCVRVCESEFVQVCACGCVRETVGRQIEEDDMVGISRVSLRCRRRRLRRRSKTRKQRHRRWSVSFFASTVKAARRRRESREEDVD